MCFDVLTLQLDLRPGRPDEASPLLDDYGPSSPASDLLQQRVPGEAEIEPTHSRFPQVRSG